MIVWQDPPPYVQYMAEAEALGRASYLGGVCSGLGIIEGDGDKVAELADDFVRRAVMARTDVPMVESAIQQGIERERAAVELLLDFGPDDGSERRQRREDQAAEYFGARCADLTLNYPSAFSLPSDEAGQ